MSFRDCFSTGRCRGPTFTAMVVLLYNEGALVIRGGSGFSTEARLCVSDEEDIHGTGQMEEEALVHALDGRVHAGN